MPEHELLKPVARSTHQMPTAHNLFRWQWHMSRAIIATALFQ